ncbi:hypothetical protein CAEBREN_21736 [Caenorhabditis brenneri]|uniref:Uncharacterized protein n=1 Tax=Caenorhabditis brenneri TaxID=135651 RepID=G0PCJ8_CAEBE|nr:hypothetical protein CAEBREN_21736 [Caenorhabditis brenneri]
MKRTEKNRAEYDEWMSSRQITLSQFNTVDVLEVMKWMHQQPMTIKAENIAEVYDIAFYMGITSLFYEIHNRCKRDLNLEIAYLNHVTDKYIEKEFSGRPHFHNMLSLAQTPDVHIDNLMRRFSKTAPKLSLGHVGQIHPKFIITMMSCRLNLENKVPLIFLTLDWIALKGPSLTMNEMFTIFQNLFILDIRVCSDIRFFMHEYMTKMYSSSSKLIIYSDGFVEILEAPKAELDAIAPVNLYHPYHNPDNVRTELMQPRRRKVSHFDPTIRPTFPVGGMTCWVYKERRENPDIPIDYYLQKSDRDLKKPHQEEVHPTDIFTPVRHGKTFEHKINPSEDNCRYLFFVCSPLLSTSKTFAVFKPGVMKYVPLDNTGQLSYNQQAIQGGRNQQNTNNTQYNTNQMNSSRQYPTRYNLPSANLNSSRMNNSSRQGPSGSRPSYGTGQSRLNASFGGDPSGLNTTYGGGSSQLNATFGTAPSRSRPSYGARPSGSNTSNGSGSNRLNATFGARPSRSNTSFRADPNRLNASFVAGPSESRSSNGAGPSGSRTSNGAAPSTSNSSSSGRGWKSNNKGPNTFVRSDYLYD